MSRENNVYDRRRVLLERIIRKDYIPFGSGRPKRQTTIDKDDILNLKIALNLSKNLNDFLENT